MGFLRYKESIPEDVADSDAEAFDKSEGKDGKKVKKDAASASDNEIYNSPIVRIVDDIISEAIKQRADDIHIEPSKNAVIVRYRIDGDLREARFLPPSTHAELVSRIKIMSQMDIAEKRIPQDGHMNAGVGETEYDIRISTFPTVHGEKIVARILNKNTLKMHRNEIGFNKKNNAIVDKILSAHNGMVLLTGPTGCGKSTTLYSFLSEINRSSINTVTVEDPVEYIIEGINQAQINPKIDFTFATALRAILRQDPNVIMIGEIRDEETATMAARAAITGHLVFSTLHTNDAPGAITRLLDMGVKPYLVADSLISVISQRLVKRLCPKCKERVQIGEREAAALGIDSADNLSRIIYKPKGCEYCDNSGYYGRIAVHEIMYLDEDIRKAIVGGKRSAEIREIAVNNGMTELTKVCREYVLEGITDISEMYSL